MSAAPRRGTAMPRAVARALAGRRRGPRASRVHPPRGARARTARLVVVPRRREERPPRIGVGDDQPVVERVGGDRRRRGQRHSAHASTRRTRSILPATLASVRAALVIAFFVLVFPSVAVAHGGGSKHGYVSTVERIVNARGIEAEASGDGHFELTAPAGHTVIVRGYEGEPYLRFDEGEVYENERSPTTYVN